MGWGLNYVLQPLIVSTHHGRGSPHLRARLGLESAVLSARPCALAPTYVLPWGKLVTSLAPGKSRTTVRVLYGTVEGGTRACTCTVTTTAAGITIHCTPLGKTVLAAPPPCDDSDVYDR